MTGAIKPPLRTIASAAIMEAARANCAARLRANGHDVEAAAFERGDRDDAWAMVHEVNKLRAEASASFRALTPQDEASASFRALTPQDEASASAADAGQGA